MEYKVDKNGKVINDFVNEDFSKDYSHNNNTNLQQDLKLHEGEGIE